MDETAQRAMSLPAQPLTDIPSSLQSIILSSIETPSQNSSVSNNQPESPESGRPRTPSKRLRRASAKARRLITEASADEDTDDDDDYTETHDPKKRKLDIFGLAENEVIIGSHVGNAGLPVKAKLVKVARAGRKFDKVWFTALSLPTHAPEVKEFWDKNIYGGGAIGVDSVTLCPIIFEGFRDVTQPMSNKDKSYTVKEFLNEKRSLEEEYDVQQVGVDVEDQSVDTPPVSFESLELIVGVTRKSPHLQVYASLQAYRNTETRSLYFRFKNGGNRVPVTFERIKFSKRFDKGGKEWTKAYIKQLLLDPASANNSELFEPLEEIEASDSYEGSESDEDDGAGTPPVGRHKGNAIGKKDRMSNDDAFQNTVDDILKKYEQSRTTHETQITEREETIKERDIRIKSLKARNETQATTITQLQSTIKTQQDTANQEIARLRAQIEAIDGAGKAKGEMTGIAADSGRSNAAIRNDVGLPYLEKQMIVQNGVYSMLTAGANEGLYWEKDTRRVNHEGTEYDERKVLQVFTFQPAGQYRPHQIVEMDGIEYDSFLEEDGKEKLLSRVGSHSVFKYKGRNFYQWIVRKKVSS